MSLCSAVAAIVWGATIAVLADEAPFTASQYIARGMQRFRENKIAESLQDYDRAAALDPSVAPHLWQRGISLYYAGEFVHGRQQFASHQAVNPHDVENAAWHFLCAARLRGVEAARALLIPIDTSRDTRVPMAEIYAFYAGRGSQDAVLRAAEKAGTQRARMYAHLYLGLYDEVAGQVDQARSHLRQAAAVKLQDHFMHDVAKVHLRQRQWEP